MGRFAPFEPRPRLALAVSGGADSMALAWLCRRWVRRRRGELVAFVVDHGLRPESAVEAERVRSWLEALDIAAHILRWTGPKPETRLQERAREARYALLFAACRERQFFHLLLAHRLEDQLETVAMRARRGSGPRGLAGIPAERFVADVRLLRPLLEIPRSRLEATLRAAGIPWLEDPSNLDLRFERARLRRRPLPAARLTALARWAASTRHEEERTLARWCARRLRFDPLGYAVLAMPAWAALEERLAALVLERVLLAVSGRDQPPRSARLRRALERLREGDASSLTISGCLLRRREGGLFVFRELRAVAAAARVEGGGRLLWDGRWHIAVEGGAAPLLVEAWGRLVRTRLGAALEVRRRGLKVPAPALPSLPVLHDGRRILATPLHPPRSGAPRIIMSFLPRRRVVEAPFPVYIASGSG